MSLLAHIPPGACLSKPTGTITRCVEPLDKLVPRITSTLLPTQRDFCTDNTTKVLGFCAGFGCLAGETLINGTPIRDLTTRPIRVQTLAGPAWATPAYVKGYAALYRVRTEGGREFLATTDHRCLSPSGWVQVGHLQSGSLVAVDGTANAPQCSETATDCSASDQPGTRSCGGSPTPWEVFAPELSQRLGVPSTSRYPAPAYSPAAPSPADWDAVKDVTYVRHDWYYDLHVPIWNHYVANGVIHHNSGKTRALCAKFILRAIHSPGTVMAAFEPTNIMIRDVWMRSFDEFLEEFDIPFTFRVSPQPEYIVHHPLGQNTILCRATETWNRVRGQNLSFVGCDEIDTSPHTVAQKASEMMLARLRDGNDPQLAVASTPEGFRWMYSTFVEHPTPDRRLIRARTTDNPHLPAGFVDSLYANYPPQLIASYINGEFTNLANTTVYPYFDRDTHWCDTTPDPDVDRLYVGIDFNVGSCFLEVLVRRAAEFHFIAEHHARDTPSVVRLLQDRYPTYIERGDLVVIPDAASRQRSTTNASESDLSLLKRGGFTVKTQLSNPAIEDRVNALNVLMLQNRLRVSPACRYLIRALETQAYDATGKPEKGRGGLDDKSGPADAAGYAIHALAGLRRYATGSSSFAIY